MNIDTELLKQLFSSGYQTPQPRANPTPIMSPGQASQGLEPQDPWVKKNRSSAANPSHPTASFANGAITSNGSGGLKQFSINPSAFSGGSNLPDMSKAPPTAGVDADAAGNVGGGEGTEASTFDSVFV
jgi:hypothetical protein